MAVELLMPQLGESVTEGTIERWLKKPGDRVERFEPLVEVVTDKVNVEIPSPVTGRLQEILAPEGTTVAVGERLAILEEAEVPVGAAEAPATEAEPAPSGASQAEPAVAPGKRRRTTPRVRRLAEERGIDLDQVTGTGPGGRVTEKDVLAAAVARPTEAAAPLAQEEEAIALSAVRRTIAQRMAQSKFSAPHAWLVMEADVTPLVRLREAKKAEFREQRGIDLTYLPFVVKATADALREHPVLNSTWAEDKIVVKKRIHIGVAVAVEAGLIVPVVRDADRLGVAALAQAIHELTDRARAGRLRLEDVQGGTFTVDNTGAFGSIVSMPIINQGQAAILAMEAIAKRPVVIDDAIAIRSVLNLCLSFDHRILDGAIAGRFLQGIKQRLEAFSLDTPID